MLISVKSESEEGLLMSTLELSQAAAVWPPRFRSGYSIGA
jgi:hypothetical protein